MKRWQINSLIAAVLLAWTFWPIACIILSMTVANLAGAQLDEGSSHPCVIYGVDYGETLYTLFVLGWLMFLTLPSGGIALLIFAGIATGEWMRSRRRQRLAAGRG